MKKPFANGVGVVEDPSEIPENAESMPIQGYITEAPLTLKLEQQLLTDWVDEALEAQKEIGFHPPVLLAMGPCLEDPNHTTTYCMSLGEFFSCEEGKQALCEIAPNFLQQVDASAYMIISECWAMATNSSEEIEKIYEKYGSLGQAPDHLKKEMLLMYIETLAGPKHKSYEILRNNNGEVAETKPLPELEESSDSTYRFGGWLNTGPLH